MPLFINVVEEKLSVCMAYQVKIPVSNVIISTSLAKPEFAENRLIKKINNVEHFDVKKRRYRRTR